MSRIWDSLRWIEQTHPDDAQLHLEADTPPPFEADRSSVRLEKVENSIDMMTSLDKSLFCLDDVPPVEVDDVSRIVSYSGPGTPAADRFRLLGMRLRLHRSLSPLKTILVTSPLPQDGKSTVSMNLAMVLTEKRSKKVLLIDFDLHRGSVSERLNVADIAGVSECLQSGADPLKSIRRVDPLGFYVLPRGDCSSGIPSELLLPSTLSPFFSVVAPWFDWVVIDSPPALALTDALSLAQSADGTLLVARAGKTPTKAVEDVIELLGRKSILGVLLNGAEEKHKGYYKYRNYYHDGK